MTEEKDLKHFTVLGPGGVGGLLAGLLARSGRNVTVVASDSTAELIASQGLRVDSSSFGDFTADVNAVPEASEPTDVLVVAPKATALDSALDRVPARIARGALIVPLLNGLEHMEALRSRYPGAHVLAAAIRVESTRVAPGHIVQSSPFAALDLARSGAPADRVDALAAAVGATGLRVDVHEDEDDVLWRKFHFLLPTALVCTHARQAIGGVRDGRRDDLLAVADEVARVAAEFGVRLDSEQILRMVDSIPAPTKPSMLRDREAGRPTEVDALGGALLRVARDRGVDTPVTARIVADLREVDARAGTFG